MYSVCIVIYVSMYLYSYPSIHGISGLHAGGVWEEFDVHLKMTIGGTQKYTPRPWSSEFRDAIGDSDWVNSTWSSEFGEALGISKMYCGHWEHLGVSESCRTRIPGRSNPRDFWTHAVAFRCTWEHLGAPMTSLGAPTTSLQARPIIARFSVAGLRLRLHFRLQSWNLWNGNYILRQKLGVYESSGGKFEISHKKLPYSLTGSW